MSRKSNLTQLFHHQEARSKKQAITVTKRIHNLFHEFWVLDRWSVSNHCVSTQPIAMSNPQRNMKNLYCSKHATGLLVALAFCLTNIPCCASQRNFLSLGTKIEDKKPTSALSRTRKQKKPFFVGAAAAEIIVDDDGEAYRRVIAILSFVVWWYKAS